MVGLQRIIDKYAGYILVLLLWPFRIFDRPSRERKRFLVIKLWAMGDSVLTLSLIRGIRESFGGCTVDVLLRDRARDVFECGRADRILNLDSISDLMTLFGKFRRYDVVFDCEPYLNLSAILAFFPGKERIGFSGQFRSRLYTGTTTFRRDQHMVRNYLDFLAIFGKEYHTEELEKLQVRDEDRVRVDDFLAGLPAGKPVVGITPGVAESSKNRMWYEERFAALADRIIGTLHGTVIFIDSPANRKTVEAILSRMEQAPVDATGRFTLKETFYLISKCRVFISNDTGPMHVAAAQGCRTIGLFGPNTPVLWGPYGKGNTAIYKTTLEPAILNDKGIFREGNRDGYMGCISVEDVFRAVEESLRE